MANIKYISIMTDDYSRCYICGLEATEMHHIFHGAD